MIFKSFRDLQNHNLFNTDIDTMREATYGRTYVLKLAEIRTMDRPELKSYCNKYGNWYNQMKDTNVHGWSKQDTSYVALFDYALNRKRSL
tara:strand:- start:521 stop:790 length:270 start_codon:yes stop_codon:yes gene_type:complete